jgi:hypothetical protein
VDRVLRRGRPWIVSRWCWFYASAVATALFCLRVLGEPWGTHFPPQFPDTVNPGRTDTYYAVAHLTPLRPGFYFAARPIAFPGFVWLLGFNTHLIVVVQTLGYCGAVVFLCVTAHRLLSTRWIAYLAGALVVLIAIEARFALWTTQILSESLGISLGIVAIALWWRVAAGGDAKTVTWAWVVTILWALERDADVAPILLVIIPVTVAVGLLSRAIAPAARRRLLAGAAVALVACVYIYGAQQIGERNRLPLYGNIGLRVLPDPALRSWFVKGGMPLDAALASRTGKTEFDDHRFFENAPSLARFRQWASGSGGRLMLESYVVRSPDWYRMLANRWKPILSADYTGYDTYGVGHRLPARPLGQLGGPENGGGLAVWFLLAVAGLVLAAVFARRRAMVVFAAGALLAAFVELYASFVGESFEVERHVAGAVNRVSVILVLCVAIAADLLWQHWRASPHSEPVPVEPSVAVMAATEGQPQLFDA